MKSFYILFLGLFLLAGCSFPWGKNTTSPFIEYPTTQIDSPAARFCTNNGGTPVLEKNPNIPSMDLIFCTFADGKKVDAWGYMNEKTSTPIISGESKK